MSKTIKKIILFLVMFAIALLPLFVCGDGENEVTATATTEGEKLEITTTTKVTTTVVVTEPVTETEEETSENWLSAGVYDVPLSVSVQKFLISECEKYGIEPSLILAVIQKESNFNSYCVSDDGSCHGLMQINECNFENYNLENPYNSKENIRVGVQMMGFYIEKYGSVEKALMAFNCGEGGASKLWNEGIYSTYYTRTVLDYKYYIDGNF